jgi:L-lactate dehydrogenase (cytochrome)
MEITKEELSKHISQDDLWIAINGVVYDVTNFINDHPGGSKPLLKYAGTDATEAFGNVHPYLDIEGFYVVVKKGLLK